MNRLAVHCIKTDDPRRVVHHDRTVSKQNPRTPTTLQVYQNNTSNHILRHVEDPQTPSQRGLVLALAHVNLPARLQQRLVSRQARSPRQSTSTSPLDLVFPLQIVHLRVHKPSVRLFLYNGVSYSLCLLTKNTRRMGENIMCRKRR